MKQMVKGALVASAVAGLVIAAGCGDGGKTTTTDPLVKCLGANDCTGKGACEGKDKDGKEHTCAGNNACKGQGWTKLKKSVCSTTAGATVGDEIKE